MLITEDEKRYRSGDIIKLEVRAEKTHLFDIETGERIREKKQKQGGAFMETAATVLAVVLLAFLAWQIWGSIWNIIAIFLGLFKKE